MKHTIGVLIAAFLLLPLLILVSSGIAPSFSANFVGEITDVFLSTVVQAALSSLLALAMGLLGAYGLQASGLKWGRNLSRFLEALSLLPNVAPVLLFLLAVMKTLPFLRGLTGVIFVHAF